MPLSARRPRHRRSMTRSASSPSNSAEGPARRSARACCAHRRKPFRAADGAPGGARAVVAALSAHRAWFAGWETARRDDIVSDRRPRSGARSKSRSTMRVLHALRARRPHRALARRHALPFSTTRPAAAERQAGADGACRRSSRWKAAILREGGFADIAAGASVGELAYVRLAATIRPASTSRWN